MILQTEHLSKSYGGRTLFHDVTFRLEEYDRLALVGPNGAGKTTLLSIISGEDDPDEGRVLFAKGARVGYLEQEAIEMGDLPVFEEVISSQTEVLEAEQRLHKLEAELGANPTEAQLAAVGRARDAYEMLGGYSLESKVRSVLFGLGFTERDMTRSTTEFSGGWQMRIALAKLLIRNPEVLLLDEPLSALDAKVRVQLRDEIRRIQLEAGTTTVFVTHDQEEALAVADRIGVMNHGRIEQIADPQTLYRRPGTEYVATFIGLTNRLPGIANGEEAVVFGQRVPLLDGSATDASTVLVRPENMTIELTDDADAVHGAGELGRVEMVHFLGALARVDVRVACAGMGGTIRVTVQLPANELPAGLAIGAQVVVAPRPIPALAV